MRVVMSNHVSWHGGNTRAVNGYGYAAERIVDALAATGHDVTTYRDPQADVQVWFDQPQHWEWQEGVYRVGYLPWESTALVAGWVEQMNQCDEIWTPSPLIAGWFSDLVTPPVHVFPHGVDEIWTPVERTGKPKFLHLGAEAYRKGGIDTIKAFRQTNGSGLTMKFQGPTLGRVKKETYLTTHMSIDDLVRLHHQNHIYVYPTWGEGFGLTPLQALATGMPVVTTKNVLPYEDLLDPRLLVQSQLVDAPTQWASDHPGRMYKPDTEELVVKMQYALDNYDDVAGYAMEQQLHVRERYNWTHLTDEMFSQLNERL